MSDPVTPRLAATLMLARDSAGGLELFMVARHHQIEFAAAATEVARHQLESRREQPTQRGILGGGAVHGSRAC